LGQPVRPVFKGQTVHGLTTNLRCVTSQKTEDLNLKFPVKNNTMQIYFNKY